MTLISFVGYQMSEAPVVTGVLSSDNEVKEQNRRERNAEANKRYRDRKKAKDALGLAEASEGE